MTNNTVARPRWGRIPKSPAKESGLGRGSIYALAKKHPALLRKFGGATLLDRYLLSDILAALPEAQLGEGGED